MVLSNRDSCVMSTAFSSFIIPAFRRLRRVGIYAKGSMSIEGRLCGRKQTRSHSVIESALPRRRIEDVQQQGLDDFEHHDKVRLPVLVTVIPRSAGVCRGEATCPVLQSFDILLVTFAASGISAHPDEAP